MLHSARPHLGFSLLEVAISAVLVIALLAVLVPALSSARAIAHKEQCSSNLVQIGAAVTHFLETNNHEFPHVAAMPGWHWGGLRFAGGVGEPYLDTSRPLSRLLSPYSHAGDATHLFCCPADRGIGGDTLHLGTGPRSACRAFGTSYRANSLLFDARLAGMSEDRRGIRRAEVRVAPSRLLVLGDPVWYEVYESTGRSADWHQLAARRTSQPGVEIGNVLFLDGSVRFQGVRRKGELGPIAIEPVQRWTDRP